MSAATGLSIVEVWVLDALQTAGARADRPYVKTKRVLDTLYDRHDIPPRPGYDVVCDLSREWVVHLLLVDFHGNNGSLDFGPSDARYTEARLSRLGAAALAAERGDLGALPIGMINGNTYVGGRRPPLDPTRTLVALRAATRGASDEELVALVGLPVFPGRCDVRGDLERFASGQPTVLELQARITPATAGRWQITNFPPDIATMEIVDALTAAAERLPRGTTRDRLRPRLPLREINDTSHDRTARIEVTLEPDVDPEAVIADIANLWGVRTQIEVALGQPLAATLRGWIEQHSRDDLHARLQLVQDATPQ